jgi:hypothetical protein
MALTELQMQKAMDYVVKKMIEDHVDVRDIANVIRWMIDNPLPSKAEYQAQVAAWEEEAKAAKIVALQAQLDRLKGE